MSGYKHNLYFKPDDTFVKGFQEIILSVSNLEKAVNFFKKVCGWEVFSENYGHSDLKKMWNLDDTVFIEEAVLRNPKDIEGFLRIIKFKNVAQQQIRSAANVWDTGGIFDINLRIDNMETMYRELQDKGWNGLSDPLRYTFNIYDVSEVLMKGPDGIVIAFMQRFAPPLVGFDHMKKTSRIFNSSVIVRDMKASHDFYVNKLGFHMFFQTKGLNRNAGRNVIGIPSNINHEITVPIDIVRPDKDNFGSIEYLHINELKGKDCAKFAKPPNLGILMYRFPVRHAETYATTLKSRGVTLNSEVQTLYIKPYGNLKIFSVRSPDGVWIEFIELID
ncbi:VOC family protein [Aquimarina sp. RZ0]|uniref:VOC family protein n=1 Tax=Aquimarina sp. RZ0 TaxID=2607730 RepID=UPI0011F0B6BA|nr:VOC family protein [Aquimarina sp. RZ0]KAA1244930.1 hypothetical protein F0000_14410 [Aquimarina sp. RZ0]